MKLNNKGFMMAEVVVVSAIILVFLTGLYVSYNKIYSAYNTRISYYDTAALYRLGFYRDYLVNHGQFDSLYALAVTNNVVEMTIDVDNNTKYNEKAFMIYNNHANVLPNVLDSQSVNVTYKDYINYLSTAVDLTSYDFLLVMERCNKNNVDDCKYAYLEAPDAQT